MSPAASFQLPASIVALNPAPPRSTCSPLAHLSPLSAPRERAGGEGRRARIPSLTLPARISHSAFVAILHLLSSSHVACVECDRAIAAVSCPCGKTAYPQIAQINADSGRRLICENLR